jgi:hypothetical protein
MLLIKYKLKINLMIRCSFNKNSSNFYIAFILTLSSICFLQAQVQNNGTLYIGDNATMYIGSSTFTFGSGSTTQTSRTAGTYGK